MSGCRSCAWWRRARSPRRRPSSCWKPWRTARGRRPRGDAGATGFLRVRVVDGDKTRVNVNVPLELARIALRFVPRDSLKVGEADQPLDPEEILRLLEEGLEGKIVDIEDEDGRTRVEVVVE